MPRPCAKAPSVERRLWVASRVLLGASVVVPLGAVLADLLYLTPDLNDGAFHLGAVRNTLAAIRDGANPIDFWVPTWLCGFPLFATTNPALTCSLSCCICWQVALCPFWRCSASRHCCA